MDSLDKFYASKEVSYFDSVRKEIETLLPVKMDRVFEVGCGSGATLQWLKNEKGCSWIGGVELSDDAASRAKDRLDFFLAGNIEKIEMPFEKGSFDLILCLDVLEHLVDPWLTVKRLSLLLKPGGAIIVSLPNIMHRSAILPLLLNDRWDYVPSGILDRTHLRFFTRKTIVEMLENIGLYVDVVQPIVQISRGSKTWFFDMLTLHIFRRLFTTQYIARGITSQIKSS